MSDVHKSTFPKPSARVRHIQKTALVLLVFTGVINYVDRSSLAIGLPLIRQELGISIAHSGWLLSSFLWVYMLCQLPAGAVVDRFGARLVLSVGLSLWSMAQVLGGLVSSFWEFIGVRGLLGVGESPQFPSCARVTADWFAPRDRGLATGIWNSASTLGTAISAPLLTILMLHLGWRWMFIIMGVAGLIVAVVFYNLHRNPQEVELSEAEHTYLSSSDSKAKPVSWQDWVKLFRFRTTWGMVFGFFGVIYMSWLYYTWLPQYLEIQWHLSIARTGWVAAIPYTCGVVGALTGGRICDLLSRRGFSTINSFKLPVVWGLFTVVLFTVLAAYSPSSWLAVVYISVSMFVVAGCSTAAWAMATVVAPKNYAASLGSIQNCGGYFGGALAPVVTGYMVQATGSFKSALLVAAGVALLACVGHLLLAKQPMRLADGGKTQ